MPLPKKLEAKLNAFLAGGKKKAEGGDWPVVSPDEIDQLHELVELLLDAKYARDNDSDLPVKVLLTDRTRYQVPFTLDIPHTHKPFETLSPMEVRMMAVDRYGLLAKHASEQANMHMSALRMEMEQHTSKQRRMTWGGVTYTPVLRAEVTQETVHQALDAAVRAKQAATPCPQDYSQKTRWFEEVAKAVSTAQGVAILPERGLSTAPHVQVRFRVPAFDDAQFYIDTKRPPMDTPAPATA